MVEWENELEKSMFEFAVRFVHVCLRRPRFRTNPVYLYPHHPRIAHVLPMYYKRIAAPPTHCKCPRTVYALRMYCPCNCMCASCAHVLPLMNLPCRFSATRSPFLSCAAVGHRSSTALHWLCVWTGRRASLSYGPLMYHSCAMHAPLMYALLVYRSCTARLCIPLMYRSCTARVPIMYRACTVHAQLMYCP